MWLRRSILMAGGRFIVNRRRTFFFFFAYHFLKSLGKYVNTKNRSEGDDPFDCPLLKTTTVQSVLGIKMLGIAAMIVDIDVIINSI